MPRWWVTTADGMTVSVWAKDWREARRRVEIATGKRVLQAHRVVSDRKAPHDV